MLRLTNPSLKKVALLVIGLGAPAYAMAAVPGTMFNGYYGGIMGGVMRTESQYSTYSSAAYNTYFYTDKQLVSSQSDVDVFKYNGAAAIYLGYGQFIPDSQFYLAGEIFGNWAKRESSLTNFAYHEDLADANGDNNAQSLTTHTTIRARKSEFGIDIRPGYLMDVNTLLYGRIGIAFNNIKTTNSTDFAYTSYGIVPGSSHSVLSQSKSHNKAALRLGVGLEHNVSDNLSVTADYIYTYYGKVKTANIGDSTFANGEDSDNLIPNFVEDGQEANSSARIRTHAIMLGIKYYFFPVC